jgi:hypothetical protein
MVLPKGMENIYHRELFKFEEEVNMQYVTTAERIGIEKGRKIGKKEGKEEGLLIGEILMAQRILKQSQYSRKSLEKMSLKELEGIHKEIEKQVSRIA